MYSNGVGKEMKQGRGERKRGEEGKGGWTQMDLILNVGARVRQMAVCGSFYMNSTDGLPSLQLCLRH